jgi:hypothetical protein
LQPNVNLESDGSIGNRVAKTRAPEQQQMQQQSQESAPQNSNPLPGILPDNPHGQPSMMGTPPVVQGGPAAPAPVTIQQPNTNDF